MRSGLVVLCLLCACREPAPAPAPAPTRPTPPGSPSSVRPDHPQLRYTGWFDRRKPDAVRFAWPASHLEAAFTGTSLRVDLTDTPAEDETRETDFMTVVVDGSNPRTVPLKEGRNSYTLATSLSSGTHRVLLWKRTETEVGTVTLHGFELDTGASLVALPRASGRRIVAIGDSITAGYGNEGPNAQCHWSAATENSHATYGAVAARELDAEYVAMAWSGKGLTRNYEARDPLTMLELYDRVIPNEDDSPRLPRVDAQAVVINLGTNDFFQGTPKARQFIDTYLRLIGLVRERWPAAQLVLAIGPMLADDYPQPRALSHLRAWVKTVIAQRRAAGDKAIELMEVWTDPAEGVGCDFHPNLETHARLGQQLAAHLRDRLDW